METNLPLAFFFARIPSAMNIKSMTMRKTPTPIKMNFGAFGELVNSRHELESLMLQSAPV